MGLDNQVPIELLDTPPGIEMVETFLGRLATMSIRDAVFIVNPDDGPKPNWLRPSYLSQGQQRFGNDLLEGTSSSRSPAPSRPTAGT
jgi:hypothetical protein